MLKNIFKSAVIHHEKKNFIKAKELYESLLKNINPKDIENNLPVSVGLPAGPGASCGVAVFSAEKAEAMGKKNKIHLTGTRGQDSSSTRHAPRQKSAAQPRFRGESRSRRSESWPPQVPHRVVALSALAGAVRAGGVGARGRGAAGDATKGHATTW